MAVGRTSRTGASSREGQFSERVRRMIRPAALERREVLPWSRGMGTDVWRIFCGAITGDLAAVKRLVRKDPRLATCEYNYFTPLHFAVRENQREVAAYLIEQGADPAAAQICDWIETPLTLARDRGYTGLQQWLEGLLAEKHRISPEGEEVARAIRDGDRARLVALLDATPARVHAADSRGNQPIHWGALTRQIDLIDLLLARGAEIDARRPDGARPIDLAGGDYWYRARRDLPADAIREPAVLTGYLLARGAEYDITVAARIGDARRVRELLAADPEWVNRVPPYSTYYAGVPLRIAAAAGQKEVVRLLLEHGADPNTPEAVAPDGGALYEAVGRNDLEIARMLLEHGANPNGAVESSGDCSWRARNDGNQEMVELLAVYGGVPRFALCCYSGWIELVAVMLQANPALAADGESLEYILGEGQETLLQLFLRIDPDLPRKIPGGLSGFKSVESARTLLERGLDPSGANWLRVTPLHFFALRGRQDLAALFLDHGADLYARDEEYRSTPLAWAARGGQTSMVEFLLARGAQRVHPDDPAWATPAAWAEKRGHAEVANILCG